jgi:hypothetical protein
MMLKILKNKKKIIDATASCKFGGQKQIPDEAVTNYLNLMIDLEEYGRELP